MCNPRFGCHKWMIFSVQSDWNFSRQNIFEIWVALTSKISALLWWDILESNEYNGISFYLSFTHATENADVFIKCYDFLFLDVMRRVDIFSRNWRWLISFGTWYILFLLAWWIVSLYMRYVFLAYPTSPQTNIDHHHFLLHIQQSCLYCMQIWSATLTDPITELYI